MSDEKIWMLCGPALTQELNGFKQTVKIAVFQEAGYSNVNGLFDLVVPIDQLTNLEQKIKFLESELAKERGSKYKDRERAECTCHKLGETVVAINMNCLKCFPF